MCMYREGVRLVYAVLMDIQLIVTVDNSFRSIHFFSDDQVNIVTFLQYFRQILMSSLRFVCISVL